MARYQHIPLWFALSFVSLSGTALACSPVRGWKPPEPVEAFERSNLVVYGVVESIRGDDLSPVAKLKNVAVLKGAFLPHNEVRTFSGSVCGIGGFEVGRAYVFFFRNAGDSVTFLTQPLGNAADVLEALSTAGVVSKP